jgi:hypothetical protein
VDMTPGATENALADSPVPCPFLSMPTAVAPDRALPSR